VQPAAALNDGRCVSRYIQLLGVVPTDAIIEKRLGEMFDADGDKTEAYTYFYNVNSYTLLLSLSVSLCLSVCLSVSAAQLVVLHITVSYHYEHFNST